MFVCLIPTLSMAEKAVHIVTDDVRECARLLDRKAQTRPTKFDASRPTVVVVDGYSSGRLLASALRDVGFQVVHVHATGDTPKKFLSTFWSRSYERILAYDGNLSSLVGKLRNVNVVAVLPGTDTGVLLADVLSTALNRLDPRIPSNGIEHARKNKFEMQERIKARGLDSIRQVLTSNVGKSIGWVRGQELLKGPEPLVVIKPLASAGGESVLYPKSEAEIRRIFRRLLKTTDGLGNVNAQLLTQEKLLGPEFALNSTIWNGRVLYTDIWQYHKRVTPTGRVIYDFDLLLPYEGEVQNELRAYDRKVLSALGIRHGNSHSEIKMVEDRGPVLIESNNRPMGATQPVLAKFATGRNQIEMTALALADPRGFRKLLPAYAMRKNAIVFSIANLYDRPMRLRPEAREVLRTLPGFFEDLLGIEPGLIAAPTEDMFNAVGEVWLLHENLDVLMKTVDELHAMEQDGRLFTEL